jgi:hypothetical protein
MIRGNSCLSRDTLAKQGSLRVFVSMNHVDDSPEVGLELKLETRELNELLVTRLATTRTRCITSQAEFHILSLNEFGPSPPKCASIFVVSQLGNLMLMIY